MSDTCGAISMGVEPPIGKSLTTNWGFRDGEKSPTVDHWLKMRNLPGPATISSEGVDTTLEDAATDRLDPIASGSVNLVSANN
jgi:hypothetical protein